MRRQCHIAEVTHAVENELNQPLRFFYMQNFDPHATAEARISDLPPPAPVPAPTLAQGVARGVAGMQQQRACGSNGALRSARSASGRLILLSLMLRFSMVVW